MKDGPRAIISPAPGRHHRTSPEPGNGYLAEHARWLIDSYKRLTGHDLVDPALGHAERAHALYQSPTVVASHGTEADPVFNYGNRAALRLFETDWETFTSMPSRLSAEPLEQAERERLFERVRVHGYIDDYSGVRISTCGRRFRIDLATVWTVTDANGNPCGHAVAFDRWEVLDR